MTMIAHNGEHGSQTNSLSLTRGRPTESAEDGLGRAPHRQSQRFVSLVRFGEAQQTAPFL